MKSIVAVHLSAASALPLVKAAKAEGLPLTVETCHHYLRSFIWVMIQIRASNILKIIRMIFLAWQQRRCQCVPPSTSAVHLSGAGGAKVWSDFHLFQEQQGGALGGCEDGCDWYAGLSVDTYFPISKGWLAIATLKPTFTFLGRDFAIFNTFTWQNPYQEKWKLVLE